MSNAKFNGNNMELNLCCFNFRIFARWWIPSLVLLYGFSINLNLVGRTAGQLEKLNETKWRNCTTLGAYRFTIPNAIGLGGCIIGIIANGLLLVLIFCNPLNNLRRSSWITIANLAMADFLTSVTSIPFCFKPSEVFDPKDKNYVDLRWANAFLYIGYSASFFMLLLFAIERYIAVNYPLRTGSILTKKRVSLACIISWIIAMVIGSFSLYQLGERSAKIWIAIFGVFEIVVVFLVGIKISLIKRLLKGTRSFEMSNRRHTQRKDIVTTLFILILVLMVTAFPYFIGKQLEFATKTYPELSLGKRVIYFPYYYFPIASLNFVLNPFIYAWRLSEYRCSFVALFTRILPVKKSPNNTSSKVTVVPNDLLNEEVCQETPS